MTEIKGRIDKARKVRLAGGAIAAIAGAISAVVAFLVKQKAWDAEVVVVAGAVVSAAGGLLTLLADYFEKSPSGTQLSIPGDLLELVDARVAIERFNRRVARSTAFPLTPEELAAASTMLDNAAEALIRFKFVKA